jgi:hypothetical protein
VTTVITSASLTDRIGAVAAEQVRACATAAARSSAPRAERLGVAARTVVDSGDVDPLMLDDARMRLELGPRDCMFFDAVRVLDALTCATIDL